jgi:diguanylate cyclase (GGDEF)-like protein/PAS domain S-box-containing protein
MFGRRVNLDARRRWISKGCWFELPARQEKWQHLGMTDSLLHPPRIPADELSRIVREAVDHLDAMVAFWDINQVCVFANRAYYDWFGKTPDEIVGRTIEQLLGPLYVLNLPYLRAAYAGQRQVFEREIPTPGGQTRHSLATYIPYVVDGEVRGIFVHVADVTPLKRLEQELKAARAKAEHLATHDFLTGVPNRVLLVDRLAQAITAAERANQMIAVISLDLDNLKLANDTYGHAIGDALLVEVASRLSRSFRTSDTVSRVGGDEFVLVVPEIESVTQVEVLVSRMLENLQRPLVVEALELVPAVSIGVALFPQHGTVPEVLLAKSDRALYSAKKRGGNQSAVFTAGE